MRAQTGTTQAKRLLLGLLVSLLLIPLLAGAQPRSRSDRYRSAKATLERATRLRADLDGTPKDKRREKDYLGIIFLYRRVYDLAPFSNIAADALASVAEMQHEMGAQFGRNYWLEAIDTYSQLRREYPQTRYNDEALFNIAQIQNVYLNDHDKAKETYQAFLQAYPKSRYAGKAREALRAMEAEQKKAAAAAAAPPTAAPGEKHVQVRNIRYWNAENYTRVVVDLDEEVKYQEARISNPDRIFLDLFNTELSTVLLGKSFDVSAGLLHRIRVAENRAGVTRVVLEVKDAKEYSVFSLPDPFRLVVDIRSAQPAAARKPPAPAEKPTETAAAKPAETGSGKPTETGSGKPAETAAGKLSLPQPPTVPRPTQAGNHTLSRALGLKVSRIVIDPGHGGHDTGTIGPTGFMEKDLVLDVARRLGKLLEEQLGAEVIYTREDDTFVPLENRIALANEQQADLFLSIHANSSRTRSVRGVETFYLNFTSDPEALDLAARENALSQNSLHELQDLVRKISTNEKLEESREFAREIQRSLHEELHKQSRTISDRGVKQAPFVVLIGGTMPSVLTEISFLSNPQDERLMKSPDGRQAVAEALFAGMTKYLENLNSVTALRGERPPAPQ